MQFRAIPRNSMQFRKYLISSFFAIIVQLHAIKYRKRKQPLLAISMQRNSDWKPYIQWKFNVISLVHAT